MNIIELDEIYEKNRLLKTVTIEIVNQCNWHCKHCYLDNKKIDMDINKIYEIIDDARKLGAYELRLSGGEVTTSPYLGNIIRYARERYMNITLLSNMSKLEPDVIACIERYGINNVETTLFSTNSSIHDCFVKSPGAWEKSINNLKILKDLGVSVLIKIWAVKSNYDELDSIVAYYNKLGFRCTINVQIYSDIHGNMKLPKEEQLSFSEYCHAVYLHDKTTGRALPIDNPVSNRLCPEYMTSIYITSNGDVIPCAKYRERVANIYEVSLIDIWEKSEILKKIQNYCWRDCDGCVKCDKREYCVRCGAMSYIKGNNYLENCTETCLLAEIRKNKYKPIKTEETY